MSATACANAAAPASKFRCQHQPQHYLRNSMRSAYASIQRRFFRFFNDVDSRQRTFFSFSSDAETTCSLHLQQLSATALRAWTTATSATSITDMQTVLGALSSSATCACACGAASAPATVTVQLQRQRGFSESGAAARRQLALLVLCRSSASTTVQR